MGRMVMAMKRFSNSLNPTYTYGKRPASSTGSGRVRGKGRGTDGKAAGRQLALLATLLTVSLVAGWLQIAVVRAALSSAAS